QLLAARFALRRARQHQLERALSDADPAHAVGDSAWTQARLSERKATPGFAQHAVGRHAAVDETQLTVATLALIAHDWHFAHEFVARRVGVDDEHAGPPMRWRLGICDREHDGERGAIGIGDEPLVAVDHPTVTVADRHS